MRNSYAIIAIVIVAVIVGGSVYGVMASVSSTVTSTVTSTSVSTVTVSPTQQTTTTSPSSTTTTTSSTTSSASTALTPVTIGTAVAFSEVYYLPMMVAEQQGFWAQHGLQVTWQKFTGGPSETQALASGQLSIGLTGCGVIFDAVSRGIGIKNVGTYMNDTEFSIIVATNSSINTIDDLNGSTFAVTSTTGLEHVYSQIVAQKNNLTFNYVTTGGLPNSLALVESGKAQALDFTVGSVASQIQAGVLKTVYNDTVALPSPWAEFCIAATNSFIQSSPSVLSAVNAAFSQTIQYIVNNPTYAKQVILNFTKSNSAVANLVYDSILSTWNPSLVNSPTALANVDNVYVQYGITPSNIAVGVNATYTNAFVPT